MDLDAMNFVEVDGLVECGQDAGSFFIGKETGKSQAGMIVDGDMEGLDAGAGITMGAIAGGADAWLEKAAKLFNIKMKEVTGSGAFVTPDRRLGRIEGSQAIEAMTSEDAGKGSFGDGKNHEDLRVRTALAAEGEDLVFELWRRLARLASRHRGEILEALREAGGPCAMEPLADGLFGDGEGSSGSAQRGAGGEVMGDHFSSREWGESGISVHSVRAG